MKLTFGKGKSTHGRTNAAAEQILPSNERVNFCKNVIMVKSWHNHAITTKLRYLILEYFNS